MAEKSFVLLSLKDDKAKNLSKALSNVTCRKILDYLASKGEATETQISKDLNVPISTVHYNMKLLADNGLVSMDEYHYSEKGKEVIHYRMRNRYIVIAPDEDDEKSIMSKLKGMLPAAIILVTGTFLVGLFSKLFGTSAGRVGNSFMAKTASYEAGDMMITEATNETFSGVSAAASPMLAQGASAAPVASSEPHFALWFFIGGLFVLLGVLLWNFTRK
ncbi:MAG: ArsR/SmtB family transcription factor [Candidatus Nanoarchaeia archaeon]